MTNKEKLTKETFNELYRVGYERANTSVILDNTSLNKGSMYYYFNSKKELSLSAINEILAPNIAKCHSTLSQTNIFTMEDVANFITSLSDACLKNLILQSSLVSEMSLMDEDFFKALRTIEEGRIGAFTQVFEMLGVAEPKALANFVVASMNGALIVWKSTKVRDDYKKSILILTNFLLNKGL